jgi:hypothetical protein
MAVPAPKVELFIDGAYVDVTDYVLGGPKFIINRGESDEHGRLRTTMATVSLRNDVPGSKGIWSPDNPSSIYYGLLQTGMPIRFSMGSDVRAVLAVRDWPQEWDAAERVAHVPLTCTGVLGQLAQGGKALESPVYRDVMRKHNDQYRVAYWPLEEESGATQFASATGAAPLTVTNFELMEIAAFPSPGSRNLPKLTTGTKLSATIPTYTSNEHKIVTIWNFPSALGATSVLCRAMATGGTVGYWELQMNTLGGINMAAYTAAGTLIDQTGFVGFGAAGHFLTTMEMTQDGVDVDLLIIHQEIDADNPDVGSAFGDTFTGQTIGRITEVIIAPNTDLDDVAVGHLSMSNDISGMAGLADSTIGHNGETAGGRIFRLCNEEAISFFISTGSLGLTNPMGIQGRETLIDIFNECLTVDQAILRETRTSYAITYLPGYTLTNLGPELILDYTDSAFGPDMPRSTTDDFLVHNDVTVRKPDGSFGRAFIDSGRLSVNDPPDGIGTYDRGPITANVFDDDQLAYLAAWIAAVRSPVDRRWPQVTVELARDTFESDTALRQDAIDIQVGQVMVLSNMPAFVAPGSHFGLVRGYREECNKFTWKISYYTSPYLPYEVEPVETSGSTLVAAVNTSATSWKLNTSSGESWDEAYEPYHIQANGEAVRVTAISTDTPAFIAAGTIAHGNNASVVPGLPAGMTVDTGQVILGWAAIRNSGTGVPDLPAGYTSLALFGNVRFFGKYYVTGDAAPTVSFTGGAANADTSARLWGMSGVSLDLDGVAATLLNSSAADIAFPALTTYAAGGTGHRRTNNVVFLLLWKQDDWTSVATPASMDAEIFDNATTTGDDQGIAGYYDIQTTPASIAAGSAVVTGGASAISRAVVVALRPLQTATVVRNINGVNVSHAAASAVTTWRLGVSGL